MRSPKGASAALLRLANQGLVTPLVSVPLVVEYESVCHRAEHRLATGLSERDVDEFLEVIVLRARPVEIYFLWRPTLRDAGDEMVLEVAVNGRADAIVTFNTRHFGEVPGQFGIMVLTPGDAMRRLRQ